MCIRDEIKQLMTLGPLPDESSYDIPDGLVEKYEELLKKINAPITRDEAIILIRLLPQSSCFGLEWTVLHLLESTDGWPLSDEIDLCPSAEFRTFLKEKAQIKN